MKTYTLDEMRKLKYVPPEATRKADEPFDYGDQATVGLCTKRVDMTHNLRKEDFGYYLGYSDDGYVVAIKDWDGRIISAEIFDTIDEMKKEWQLD